MFIVYTGRPSVWCLDEKIIVFLICNLSSSQIVPSNSDVREAVDVCSSFKMEWDVHS
jgi:hypothetical protein